MTQLAKTVTGIAVLMLLSACSGAYKGLFKNHHPHEAKHYHRVLPDVTAFGDRPQGFNPTNYLQASKKVVQDVEHGDVQVVNEGNRITLILPTDKYFLFGTSKLNDLRHAQLSNIIELLRCFPNSNINIAGFTDEIGRYEDKRKMSQQYAQAVLAYLWARGVPEKRLNAQGYGDKYPIANNQTIHGSAMNRRVEIQWYI